MDLLFLLDASGSSKFQNEFFKGTKEFIEGFLDEFVLDTFVNVGIISFANEVELNLPLKVDYYSLCQMKFTELFAWIIVSDGRGFSGFRDPNKNPDLFGFFFDFETKRTAHSKWRRRGRQTFLSMKKYRAVIRYSSWSFYLSFLEDWLMYLIFINIGQNDPNQTKTL